MLKKIPVARLSPGMYIHKLPGPWMRHSFWRTSFLVDQDDVRAILGSGIEEVLIDVSRGKDLDVGQPATEAGLTPAAPPCVEATADGPVAPARGAGGETASLQAEIVRARRVCRDGGELVSRMFRDIRLGRVVDPEGAMPIVEEIRASVLRNPSALISVARLKTADDYTYLHSVAVSALMVALAAKLGLDADRTLEAGMGGLLHDMGKARMPLEVLNKPGKLTDDEYGVMKRHPEAGHALLCEGGIANAAVLDIALHHHEKVDGSGYPHRLAGEGISLLSRMAAVCDVYDAITSDRPYKAGWDPALALHRMGAWTGHFDPPVFKAFVRSLGIYPVGALVRLESEKLAVVTEQHPESLLKPTVKAFYSVRHHRQIHQHSIDLAATDCQDRIAGVESPTAWGFKDLDKLWMP